MCEELWAVFPFASLHIVKWLHNSVIYYYPKDSHYYIPYMHECMRSLSSNCSKDIIYTSDIEKELKSSYPKFITTLFSKRPHLILIHMKDQ